MAGRTSSLTGRQRIGYFLLGAAISCVIVQFILSNRARARREELGRQQSQPGLPPVQETQQPVK